MSVSWQFHEQKNLQQLGSPSKNPFPVILLQITNHKKDQDLDKAWGCKCNADTTRKVSGKLKWSHKKWRSYSSKEFGIILERLAYSFKSAKTKEAPILLFALYCSMANSAATWSYACCIAPISTRITSPWCWITLYMRHIAVHTPPISAEVDAPQSVRTNDHKASSYNWWQSASWGRVSRWQFYICATRAHWSQLQWEAPWWNLSIDPTTTEPHWRNPLMKPLHWSKYNGTTLTKSLTKPLHRSKYNRTTLTKFLDETSP